MNKCNHKIYNFVCQYNIDYDTHPHAEQLLKTIILLDIIFLTPDTVPEIGCNSIHHFKSSELCKLILQTPIELQVSSKKF